VSERHPFDCQPISSAHTSSLSALFEREGSSCYCEWWHFEGDKNAWQGRLAHAPGENRSALITRCGTGTPAGVVALADSGEAVGWMKLTPAESVPKLYAQRPYRGLPCLASNRGRTWTVGCFLVASTWRRRGVADALLRTGLEVAQKGGAAQVEAFPRRADGLRDEELWTGPYGLFRKHGFEIVHELAQYPVVRRML
jgi:GNAT superfamily N-acetyltransferase